MTTLKEARTPERRAGWPHGVPPEFWTELMNHMGGEEEKFRICEERMARIEEDLRPIKKMYWAVIGSASVGILLLASLLYIYQSDKSEYREGRMETRELASSIYKQGIVLERLFTSHTLLEQDYRRTIDRINKNGGAK